MFRSTHVVDHTGRKKNLVKYVFFNHRLDIKLGIFSTGGIGEELDEEFGSWI